MTTISESMTGSLGDPRVRALQSTGLLDSAPERAFDRLTRLAAGVLDAPVALVSLVDERRQFFKSAFGLKEPWASRRETPLTHSFCQYVTRDRSPLVVPDARLHPVLRDNLALRDLSVVAYVGVPLFVSDEAVGSLCVIDDKPREWSEAQLQLLSDLAESVVSEIDLRLALKSTRSQRALTAAVLESLADGVVAVDTHGTFVTVNEAARRMFDDVAVGKNIERDGAMRFRVPPLDHELRPIPKDGPLGRGMRGESCDDLPLTILRPGSTEATSIEANGRPVYDDTGALIAAVGVYRDVTEKKRAADLYSAVVANIPGGVVILFDRELRCLALDGGLARSADIAPGPWIGMSLRDISGFGAGDARFDHVEDLCRRTLEGASLNADYQQSHRTLALHTKPVRDAFGNVTMGIVLALDVTHDRKTEAALRRSEQLYRLIAQYIPNGAVLLVDRELRYVAADGPAISALLERANLDGFVGRYVEDVVAPENRDVLIPIYRSALAGNRHQIVVQRYGRAFDVSLVPIFDGAIVSHALVFIYDNTERARETEDLRRMHHQLVQERSLFATTIANIKDAVVLLDADRRILLANEAYSTMFAMDPARFEGLTLEQFTEHVATLVDDPKELVESLRQESRDPTVEFTFQRPRRQILRRTWTPVSLPSGEAFLVTWHEVTAERDLLTERERLSLIDTLTGIPNRRSAEIALRAEHDRTKRFGTPLTIAIFDVDHFKNVNDQFGHAVGDEVLRQIATELAREARATDTVARWGGEEFIAILPVAIEGAMTFCERARRSIENLEIPMVNRVTVSAGAAQLAPGEAPSTTIIHADERLYEAKRSGRNRSVG